MSLSVVIPVFNESSTLEEIVAKVCAQEVVGEVILVDDGSTDGSAELAEQLAQQHEKVQFLRHEKNLGKGGAVITGFQAATGEVILIQDADLEYDPAEYKKLVAPIQDGSADVVYGSRYLGRPTPSLFSYAFLHTLGNQAITWFSNRKTGLGLTDVETCYKTFRREVLQEILPTLKEQGFGIDPELTAKVARLGCRVLEVPVGYEGRKYSQGKKIRLRDAFIVLRCIRYYAKKD